MNKEEQPFFDIDYDNEDNEDNLDRCPVCLDFQTCDSIIMECCDKLIHSDCLSTWLRTKNNCPLCRTQQSTYYNTLNHNNDIIDYNDSFRRYTDIFNLFNNLGVSSSFADIAADIGVSSAADIGVSLSLSSLADIEDSVSNPFDYFQPLAPRARRRRRFGFSFPNEYIPLLRRNRRINNVSYTDARNNNNNIDISYGISMANNINNDNLLGITNVENDNRVNDDLNINFDMTSLNDNTNYLRVISNLLNSIQDIQDRDIEEID